MIGWKKKLPLPLGPILVTLLLLIGVEVLLRYQIRRQTIFEDEPLYAYHPRLGWAPKPGKYQQSYGEVTITPEGLRQVPASAPLEKRPRVLAIGDSFTFGYFVPDEATWPNALAEWTGWSVLNAGVAGYGLDQMLLRIEELLPKIVPDLLILQVIADTSYRCQLSRRGENKPYFKIVDGELKLKNLPVPPPEAGPGRSPWYRRSVLLDRLFFRTSPRPSQILEHNQGEEVSFRLCERIHQMTRERGIGLLVVILPFHPNLALGWDTAARWQVALAQRQIPTLNFYPWLEETFPDPAVQASLFLSHQYHLSGSGYAWVGEEIAVAIRQLDLLPPPSEGAAGSPFQLMTFLEA